METCPDESSMFRESTRISVSFPVPEYSDDGEFPNALERKVTWLFQNTQRSSSPPDTSLQPTLKNHVGIFSHADGGLHVDAVVEPIPPTYSAAIVRFALDSCKHSSFSSFPAFDMDDRECAGKPRFRIVRALVGLNPLCRTLGQAWARPPRSCARARRTAPPCD